MDDNKVTEKMSRSEAAKVAWARRRAKAAALAAGVIEAVVADSGVGDDKPFITEPFKDEGMAQIYSSGMEYAFVGPDGKQCHAFAFCKDFLQDAVWSMLNKSKAAIYGFSYTFDKNPALDMENTRLSVRFKGQKGFKEMCIKSLSFMHALEPAFGMGQSSLLYGGKNKDKDGKDTEDDVWVFAGDKKWMYSPPLISLYSLFLRVGLTFEGGSWEEHLKKTEFVGKNDRGYLNSAMPAIAFLNGKKMDEVFAADWPSNYPADANVSYMHNSSGIACLGNGNINTSVNKNWKIKSIKG